MKKMLQMKIYIIVMMIGLLVLANTMIRIAKNSPMSVANFSKGWNVSYHGTQEYDVDLSEYAFKELKEGDEVILENTLPQDILTGTQIRVYTEYAVLNVYINGKDEYSYGYGFERQDKVIPGVYHRITLVRAQAGRTIRIQYQVKDDDAFTILPAIYIGDAEGIYGKFIQDNLLSLSVGIVLTLVGFLLSLVTCIIAFGKPSIAIIFYAANFSLLMGLWSLADMSVLNLILNNPEANYMIKYVSLYLCPISIVMIFKEINANRSKWRRIFLICTVVDYVFCFVSFGLYYAKVIHINETLVLLHALIGIEIILSIRSVLEQFNYQRKKDLYLIIGLLSFTFLVVLDMFRFNLDLYASKIGLSIHLLSSFMPFGALAFLVCIFLCYAFDVTDQRRAEEERARLQELAYRDRLTNLYNRQKCDDLLKEKEEKGEAYTIINFDLNDLKVMNDSKGHLHGDMLISGFAKILEKSFQYKNHVVGRMGGDEFIAIMSTTDQQEIRKALKAFEDRMKLESESGNILYSCAYGVASSNEPGVIENKASENSIYELADQRMYEMKRSQKNIVINKDEKEGE